MNRGLAQILELKISPSLQRYAKPTNMLKTAIIIEDIKNPPKRYASP